MRPFRGVAPTEGLSKSQQAIRDTLAWFASVRIYAPTRGQVAFQAGVSAKSSGYKANLSALRSKGLIDYPGPATMTLTDVGDAAAVTPAVPLTTQAMQAAIMARLSKSQRALLYVLVDLGLGVALTREDLAEQAGVSPSASGFKANLSTLRGLGLIDYPELGAVSITDMMYVDAS